MFLCENLLFWFLLSGMLFFFFSSRRRHTRLQGDWSSDVCSSDLGRLVRVAPVADLVGAHGEFVVRVEPAERALEVVRTQPWGAAARIEDGALVTTPPSGRGRDLVQFLAQAGLWPDSVSERQHDLEEIFLELTAANGGV